MSVRCVVRIRPSEIKQSPLDIASDNSIVLDSVEEFKCDSVYAQQSTQQQLFDAEVRRHLDSIFAGICDRFCSVFFDFHLFARPHRIQHLPPRLRAYWQRQDAHNVWNGSRSWPDSSNSVRSAAPMRILSICCERLEACLHLFLPASADGARHRSAERG